MHILPTSTRNVLVSRLRMKDEEQVFHPAVKSLLNKTAGLHMLLGSGITQAIYINRKLFMNHSMTLTHMQEQMTVV